MTVDALRTDTRTHSTAVAGLEGWEAWSQEVLALTKRWFILLSRERLELLFSLLQPAIWLVFFGNAVGRAVNYRVIGTTDYLGFVLPGIIAFTVVGGGLSGAMPLLWDKETGYLDKLMSMPIARSSVIVSRFLYQLTVGSAQVILLLLVGLAMGIHPASGLAGVLLIWAASALLTLAIVAAFAALAYWVPHHGTFFAVTGFITMPVLFVSNAFVPLHAMPVWMAVAARANPLTYAIETMRILVLRGWTSDLAPNLAVLLLFSLACLAIGTDQFRRQTGERV